jgi:nucleoside phosphorylase
VTATAASWRRSLQGASGLLITVTAPVITAAEKAALFAATGAVAVDMESALAGRVAAVGQLPFLVVRAIADDAGQGLPQAALAG